MAPADGGPKNDKQGQRPYAGAVAALKIAQASALRLLKSQVQQRPVLGSWQALLNYLHVATAHQPIEQVRVRLLDNKNILIREELMSEASIDKAAG